MDLHNDLHMMSTPSDWEVSAVILEQQRRPAICEIGAGNGDWGIAATITAQAEHLVLVEDFSFTKAGFDPGYFWPRDSFDLLRHCHEELRRLSGDPNLICVTDVTQVPERRYDIIRLDCLTELIQVRVMLDWICEAIADDGLLFVDDLPPNKAPNRWIACVEKIAAGVLKPVWFGQSEGVFCKASLDCRELQDLILARENTGSWGAGYTARRAALGNHAVVQTLSAMATPMPLTTFNVEQLDDLRNRLD